jgi:plastocyanin
MKKLFVVLAILFIGILLAGCTSQPPAPVVTPTPTPTPVPTTVPEVRGCYAVIADDPQFSVLGTALRAAKLETAFDNGSFTILAPADTAFAQLPNDTVPSLLKNPEQLKQLLLNHVIDKSLLSAEIVKVGEAKTMQGTVLKVNYTGDSVTIGGAKVTKTDIVCKNGVIHVVDRVIIPPVEVKTTAPTPTPTPQPSKTITFTRDLTIMPSTSLSIPVGGKIVWKNDDPLKPHGIAALNNPDPQSLKYFGNVTANNIPYGKSFEVTFDKVGAYDYTTVFQPQTTGRITVTAK